MITSQNKGTHNTPDPFLAEIQGCRYAVANEPKSGLKLNDSIVKVFGSQEPVKYRMLYSNDPVILNTQIKLNIYCNNKLEFDGNDGGLARRLRVVKYISKFDEKPNEKNNIYKIDYNLSKTVELWKEDYMKMLIELYNPDFSYVEPSNIKKWSSEYCDNNNDVKKFVKDSFIMTNNPKDYLLLKDLKLMYQQNKEYEQTKLKNLKEYLEKEFNADFKDRARIKINNKWSEITSVMFGWKRIEEEVEEVEEDDKSNLDL
jgi:phage/plasmid-associated DNA primase